jgi:hypothetical protein
MDARPSLFRPQTDTPGSPTSESPRLRSFLRATATVFALIMAAVAALGLVLVYQHRMLSPAPASLRHTLQTVVGLKSEIPPGKLPGPPRDWGAPRFVLNESNSVAMTGANDPANERWLDLADNAYSARFMSTFSYQPDRRPTPCVRVQVANPAPTLTGRLEARELKPNFAYQIKLRGIFAHHAGFEAIGYVGRWRLPGLGTNYSDSDYRRYPDKTTVESYILFDYFVTDRQGNAIRDFTLDSSLHVLWKEAQSPAGRPSDRLPVVIDASDGAVYAVPRADIEMEFLWAEREMIRYHSPDQIIRLPAGPYVAELVLTEESFHSTNPNGGYWATVMSCPVTFTVTP